jgi:hypothetical protein
VNAEHFLPEVEANFDPAEVGNGCLLPERDDPREERGCDEFED